MRWAKRAQGMGNKNASSPGGKQSCENYSEALLYNPNAYIASSSTNLPTGGSLAGELEPVHSLALLHSIENALVSGGDKVRAPFARRAIVHYHVLIASFITVGDVNPRVLLCSLVKFYHVCLFFNT